MCPYRMIGSIYTLLYAVNRSIRKESRTCCDLKFWSIVIVFAFAYITYYLLVIKNDIPHNYHRWSVYLPSDPIQSNYFNYYPETRSFEEMQQIVPNYLSSTNNLWNHFHKYSFSSLESSSMKSFLTNNIRLAYLEELFQGVDFPVLWLDSFGDVHWNQAAEREVYTYLMEKQFPPLDKVSTSKPLAESYIRDCQSRQLLILEQWRNGGFLSRVNCLIEQFGQSLYTPAMAVLSPRIFSSNGTAEEDFLEEGIVRYIYPISRCDAYLHHSSMSDTREAINEMDSDIPQQTKFLRIETFQDLRQRSELRLLYLPHTWKFGYEHVPHRRWLFDYDRKGAKNFVNYDSSKSTLIKHDEEHIYLAPNIKFNLSTWNPNNIAFYPSSENFQTDYVITWKDKVFTSFIRYMMILYVHHFSPRIHLSTKLLTLHWTKYLGDKYRKPYHLALNEMAGIFIRRGDKMPEDSFWQKHQHWRNVSYYVKGLIDEEKIRNKTFSSIFVMTDDASVMGSILEYASTKSSASDEAYARRSLYGRQILYNVFAPHPCFNPITRVGFDQFLVSLNFLVEHASFIVSHTDSNVGRFIERLIYAKRQIRGKKTFQTSDFVKNAPDSLD